MVSVAPDQATSQDNSHGGADVPSLDEDEEAASALPGSDDNNERLAIAEPVPNDEPFSIGIRLHDNEDQESPPVADAACTRRDSFRAVVLDAQPIIDVTSRVDELHPNQLNRSLKREIDAYYWQRVAFRCCVLISLIGVGLGISFGLVYGSRGEGGQDEQQLQPKNPPLDSGITPPLDGIHSWEVTPLAPGETCTDDPSWQGIVPGVTCEAVALNPREFCGWWRGSREGEGGNGGQAVIAHEACLKSCTACDGNDPMRQVVPTTKPEGLECTNSKEWQSFVDKIDCDFVKSDPSELCGFVGKESLEFAFMACPESCFDECVRV